MQSVRSKSLMVAALAALAGGLMAPATNQAEVAVASVSQDASSRAQPARPQAGARLAAPGLAALLGLGRAGRPAQFRRAGYGWSNRHAQRVALKTRNQARHRARLKGARA